MNELAINWLRDNAPAFVKAAIDAQEDELRAENGRLRAELDEALPILECLADMHRVYKLAFDDYLKSCADDGHIHDCLTHGHIRKAAEILERIDT